MRRSFALLALLFTTLSNVAVPRCAPAIAHSSETQTEVAVGHHGHPGHAGSHHEEPDHDDGHSSHPAGSDCGVVMACGAALGGQGVVTDRALPAAFAENASVTLSSPSAVDLTQDPPPPRRHA